MRDPIVTVVVPAYNAERTISETVSSVLAQTFTKFELIIVNDGSVDETANIVEQNFLGEPRISLINQQNGGTAAARNRGLAAARSELIAPLDSDDLWHPTYLEKQLNTLEKHDTAGFVYAWSRGIDSESKIIWTAYYPLVAGRVLNQLLYWNLVGNGSAMLFRKSAALEFGGYDRRIFSTEDLLLQIKLASRHECAVTPEYLVGYRRRPGQKSSNPERMYCSMLRTLDIVRNECEGVSEKVVNWNLSQLHFEHGRRAYSKRRMRGTVRLLKLAYQCDPVGTIYNLYCHATQRLNKLVQIKRPNQGQAMAATTPFFHAQTDETLQPPRFDLISRRLRYVRQLDANWPHRFNGV
jgi:glycosyltransferase involved in cell wall biosynthesis